MTDNDDSTTTANDAMEGKLAAQQEEIRRLSDQLSMILENRAAGCPAASSSPTRHAMHAGDDMGPSRCNRDDLSIFAGSEFGSPPRSVPSSYDPHSFLDDLVTPAQPGDTSSAAPGLQLDDDLYEGVESFGPSIDGNIASRITKATTLPPKKDSFEKISKLYLTPSNAKSVCAPRIEEQLWATIPQRARSADARAQHFQKNLIHGMLPYVGILKEVQIAVKEQRPVDTAHISRLTVDGITMCGFASYEMSMKRREELKPFFNPKYRGICNRSIPPGEYLFGEDLQASLKKASETYQVGQRISPGAMRSSNRAPRRVEPYTQRRPSFHRDRVHQNYTDRMAAGRRFFPAARSSRPPPPKFRAAAPSTSTRPDEHPTKN